MKHLTEEELEQTIAGGDTLAADIGQFLGGGVGWIRSHQATYFLLGPGIGGIAAMIAGFQEANK